jgi:membrane protein involved in colicin uptake
MIKVRAIRERGFYRLGRHFTHAWQEFPDGYFTAEQVKRLKDEPNLQVETVSGKTKAETEAEAKAQAEEKARKKAEAEAKAKAEAEAAAKKKAEEEAAAAGKKGNK